MGVMRRVWREAPELLPCSAALLLLLDRSRRRLWTLRPSRMVTPPEAAGAATSAVPASVAPAPAFDCDAGVQRPYSRSDIVWVPLVSGSNSRRLTSSCGSSHRGSMNSGSRTHTAAEAKGLSSAAACSTEERELLNASQSKAFLELLSGASPARVAR